MHRRRSGTGTSFGSESPVQYRYRFAGRLLHTCVDRHPGPHSTPAGRPPWLNQRCTSSTAQTTTRPADQGAVVTFILGLALVGKSFGEAAADVDSSAGCGWAEVGAAQR